MGAEIVPGGMSELDELRAEYRRILGSMEFASAMGHSQTLGRDPRLQPVLDRADELKRRIAELERDPRGPAA